MAKQKLLRTICLALLIVMVLICAIFIIACSNNQTPGNGQETEQGGEDEIPDNTPDDDDEIPGSSDGEDVVVTSIKLNVNALTLEVGESYTLTATVLPSNATDKNITWSSSNTAVATVSGGKVSAVGSGAATITATTSNGKTATCSVTVTESESVIIEVTSVSLNQTSLYLEVGENETLTATILPNNATDKNITWSSSDASVATVTNGTIMAIGSGTTTITVATSNGKTATCTVMVTNPYADFSFAPSGNGYMLTGYSGTDTTVSVPAEYNGKPVTIIGDRAFYDCAFITKIILPDTIKEIGASAFGYCTSLQTVEIPTCTRIGGSAFIGCTSLAEVTLPEGLISIGDSLFTYCNSLRKVTILSGNISANVFAGCSSLEEIVLGEGVASVARGAFEDCTSLKYLTMPRVDENTSFNEYYFNIKNSRALEKLTITNQLISVYNEVFDGCGFELNILQKFPVESISVAGEAEQYLDELSLDDYILRVKHTDGWIEDLPLAEHLSETDKQQLQQAGAHTLSISYGDKSCKFDIVLNLHTFDEAVLEDLIVVVDGTNKYLQVTGVPEGTEIVWENNGQYEVGEYTVTATLKKQYYEDKTLTATLVIAQSSYGIAYILGLDGVINENPNEYSFGNNLILKNAESKYGEFDGWFLDPEFEQEIIEIADITYGNIILYAKWDLYIEYFDGNVTGLSAAGAGLDEIIIPSKIYGEVIIGIGDSAFKGSKITKVIIPNSVTNIGDDAFNACFGLVSVEMPDSIANIGDRAFAGCCMTSVVIPNSVTDIGECAFNSCIQLVSIELPDSIINIGDSAFGNCTKLASIELPGSIVNMGYSVFSGCSALAIVNISEGVTAISMNMFRDCSNLVTIIIPNSVVNIGYCAFYGCSSLISVGIPDSVISIEDYAFKYCSSLSSVSIGKGVQSIGDGAFENCSNISGVYITDIASWCGIKFSNTNAGKCYANPLTYAEILYLNGKKLQDLVIPEGVTSIGDYAFNSCKSIVTVNIPESVTSIGLYAFSGCDYLIVATFKNPYGWKVSYNGTTYSNISASLTDVSVAATYLRSTRAGYYWKRY